MTKVCVTVWDRAHDDRDVRAVLDDVRPQIIQLHVDPIVLATRGKRASDRLRSWYPGVEIWWGVPGDSHGPDPSAAWLRAYRAACDAGVTMLVLDPESAWKTRGKAREIAKRCMLTLANAKHTGTALGLTSFDTVSAVPYKDAAGKQRYWGGHSAFPWREFLGPGSPIDAHFPQVYAAASTTVGRGALQTRNRRSRLSLDTAIVKGTIRAPAQGLAWHVYLQSHHTPTDDLVDVARTYAYACFWATPTRLDAAGKAAMETLARAYDAGVAGHHVGAAAPGPQACDPDETNEHPESACGGEHC